MKTIFSLICLLIVAFTSQAQEKIIFSGKISKADYNSKKKRFDPSGKVKNAEIFVYEGSQLIENFSASKKGDFSIFLQADLVFNIDFVTNGYISKRIQVDTRKLTVAYLSQDRKIYSDIRLFERVAGVNFAQYERLPVAKCGFDKEFKRMEWDFRFSEQTFSTLLNMVNSENNFASMKYAKKPTSVTNETITEEESNYTQESEWLDTYLHKILAKL